MQSPEKKRKLSREDILKNKRDAEKIRLATIKSDPIKLAEYKEKERLKYLKKKEKGQRKSVKKMTPLEQEIIRKKWKEYSTNYRQKKQPLNRTHNNFRRQNTSSTTDGDKQPIVSEENRPIIDKYQRAKEAIKRGESQRKYRNKQRKNAEAEDSSLAENEIKVFCPKCDVEVSHTAEGIQQDQTKLLIAKVYHYLEQEYEELKIIYGDLDLTPLSKFRQRTALATGVSETTVLQILKEEEGRNADKRQELPKTRRRARKRPRQTDSASEEDSSDDNVDDNEHSSYVHDFSEEPEIFVPVAVKVEPSDVELNEEQAQPDPISLDVKTEPSSDVVDETNETLALNEPAGTKRRARKIPRSDVTYTRQHTQGECCGAAAASDVPLTQEQHQSSLFGDTEIKTEEIEIHQEGFS